MNFLYGCLISASSNGGGRHHYYYHHRHHHPHHVTKKQYSCWAHVKAGLGRLSCSYTFAALPPSQAQALLQGLQQQEQEQMTEIARLQHIITM